MLTLAQQGYLGCLVTEDGREITQFTRYGDAPCVIDGTEYRFGRHGLRDTFAGPLGIVATAYPSGHREVTIDCDPHQLLLRKLTRLGKRWEVEADGQPAGTCRVRAFDAIGDFPAEIPLPVRVFALHTVLMHSDRSILSFLPWF